MNNKTKCLSICAVGICILFIFYIYPSLPPHTQSASGIYSDLIGYNTKHLNSIGEKYAVDNLLIVVKDVEFIDPHGIPDGAKLLCINIEVTNIGQVVTHRDTLQNPILLGMGIEDKNRFKLNFADTTIHATGIIRDGRIDHIEWKGFGNVYPNIIKNGWVYFEVPININLNATTFETYGEKWILSSQ